MNDGVLQALLPGVAGVVFGAGTRYLAAHLRRGAVLPVGSVEIPTGLLAAAAGLLVWPHPTVWLCWWITAFGVVLAAIDLRHHRIPDAISYPVMVGTAGLCLLLAPQLTPGGSGTVLLRALIAAVVVGLLFALPAVFAPGAMGWGDVKLAVSLGATLGAVSWDAVLSALLITFVSAGLMAILGLVSRRLAARSAIAFGPFLVAGAFVAVLLAGAGEVAR